MTAQLIAHIMLEAEKPFNARKFISSTPPVYTELKDLDAFTRCYLDTALWGESLEVSYSLKDISGESLVKAKSDCDRFRAENAADIENLDDLTVARNFLLSRNGHGSGFFDEDTIEDLTVRDRLQAASERFGGCFAYVGDDGRVDLT